MLHMKKAFALGLATVLAATTVLTGCGSSSSGNSDSESLEFGWLLGVSENSYFYSDYNENPIVPYWEDMTWNVDGEDTKVSIEFTALPSGSETDTMNTLLATGDYPDIIPLSYSSESAAALYDEGVLIDLTDYVAEYMPNYSAWLEEHPQIAKQLENNIDGESKIIQLYNIVDEPEIFWGGFMYRRDWIVTYGTNPQTGEAFTGGWNEDKTEWTDDVVFPSGESDPVYISDWEWMFDIFETAMKAEGITDGYAFQVFPTVGLTQGDLVTGFGGGSEAYYLDEDGVCRCGYTSDNLRAYLQCLNSWYENGWTDPAFDEQEAGMFWKIDTEKVYSGKVGCWYGQQSAIGNLLESAENPYTEGICAYGAAQPINDIYGSADQQYQTPDTYFTTASYASTGIGLTDKISEKNIGAILTAIDYLYSEEGGMLRKGYSNEQQEELKNQWYIDQGLEDGAYSIEEKDGEDWIIMNPVTMEVDGLSTACGMGRLVGLNINHNLDQGYSSALLHTFEQWQKYEDTGRVTDLVSGQLTSEQSDETSLNTTNIRTYTSQAFPDFVTGRTDIDSDSDWQAYCDEVSSYNPELYAQYINEVLGN